VLFRSLPQSRERVFIIGHLRDKPTPAIFPIYEGGNGSKTPYVKEYGEGQWIRDSHTRAIDSCYYKGWGGNRTVILMAHTKANIKQRVQNRNTMYCLDTTKHKQGLIEGEGIRKLTPLECERLMGFPDNWTAVDGISDTQRYKMIGNAVMPVIIEMIASRLLLTS